MNSIHLRRKGMDLASNVWSRMIPPCLAWCSPECQCPSLKCQELSSASPSPSLLLLLLTLWQLCCFQDSPLILPFQSFCNGTCCQNVSWSPLRWTGSEVPLHWALRHHIGVHKFNQRCDVSMQLLLKNLLAKSQYSNVKAVQWTLYMHP